MIIVACGDSFIWGSELADSPHGGANGHSRSTFPALLAQQNNYQYLCVAYPGASNRDIANQELSEIEDNGLLNNLAKQGIFMEANDFILYMLGNESSGSLAYILKKIFLIESLTINSERPIG
mgnify:CR=1 FL=1